MISLMTHVTTAHDQDDLVSHLRRQRIIRCERVDRAMRRVDRRFFCPHGAYCDSPQGIGYGSTISAPHIHAFMLELLKDHAKEGAKVLDVGCGSGYMTAALAQMVGESGYVVGIDHVPDLVDQARLNIERANPDLLLNSTLPAAAAHQPTTVVKTAYPNEINFHHGTQDHHHHHHHHSSSSRNGGVHWKERVKLVCGDGRMGFASDAPYDAIHVGAGALDIPDELINQLKPGGRLILPVGSCGNFGQQRLTQVDVDERGGLRVKDLIDVMFMLLCDVEDQWHGPRKRSSHGLTPSGGSSTRLERSVSGPSEFK